MKPRGRHSQCFGMSSIEKESEWRDDFVLSSAVREVGGQARHYRSVASGELWRAARGAYLVDAPVTDEERYLAQIRARLLVSKNPPILSHWSAALLWGLPILGRWPDEVHVEVGTRRNGRSIPGLVRHRSDGIVEDRRGGIRVTSLARTVLDVAASSSLRTAVVIVDSALAGLVDQNQGWLRPPISRDGLREEFERAERRRGSRQLEWTLRFGDGRAASPGESVSRLTMHQIGCPAPELQHSFYDSRGRFVATTDFWWPEFNLTGEFDGRGKYLRDEYANGRTTAQIVVDEKVREDRVRALGPGMSRWVWEEALSTRALRRKLTLAGLPLSK
jgi:hypothetical protein